MSTPFLIFYALFFFALGACIGSFLNVVIWRLPHRGTPVRFAGQTRPLTLSWPPSHCPVCSTAIPWYQNIPVFAWLVLRGRCARCHTPIAIRYPLVELSTGLLFSGLFLAYFVGGWNRALTDFTLDWPFLLLNLFLVASLLAASAIDADWVIIPDGIPWLMAAVGLLAAPFLDRPAMPQIDPRGDWAWPTLGALAGWLAALALLHARLLPRSFAHLEAPAEPPPEKSKKERRRERKEKAAVEAAPLPDADKITPPPNLSRQWPSILATLLLLIAVTLLWTTASARIASFATVAAGLLIFLVGVLPRDPSAADVLEEVVEEISVPEARREMLKELAFLAFPVMGALIASMFPHVLPNAAWLGRLLAALCGLLLGGAVVWITRIGGTLLFGKEAMGLGDIHLMCGVGAILGPLLVTMSFFVFAPPIGLLWALTLLAMRKPNVLPYGPWLSVGAILSLLVGQPLLTWYLRYLQ